MKSLIVDFNNWNQLLELMDNADDYPCSLFGKTEDGELMITSILPDMVINETYQNNKWIRKMYYHRDFTVEEMYDREEEDDDVEETVSESIMTYANQKLELFAKFCKLKGTDIDDLLKQFMDFTNGGN